MYASSSLSKSSTDSIALPGSVLPSWYAAYSLPTYIQRRSADYSKLVFIALTNILLITSLISLLSNSLTKVSFPRLIANHFFLGKIDWLSMSDQKRAGLSPNPRRSLAVTLSGPLRVRDGRALLSTSHCTPQAEIPAVSPPRPSALHVVACSGVIGLHRF